MKPRITLIAAVALASGLLLSNSNIRRVHADDRDEKACSNKTLKGTYGFYRTGTSTEGPIVGVGFIFWDGKGNGFARQSISRNGVFNFDVEFDFTYEVYGDCTGKSFFNGVEFVRMVIVDGGKELYQLSETAGNTVYSVVKKIHTHDDDHDR